MPDLRGTARSASRVAMMITGRMSRASAMPPASTMPRRMPMARAKPAVEHAVDDGRHGGEVLHVDLDQPVVPALAVGELLEVHRRGDAERDGQNAVTADHPDSAQDRRARPGGLRRTGEVYWVNRSRPAGAGRHEGCRRAGPPGRGQRRPGRTTARSGRPARPGCVAVPVGAGRGRRRGGGDGGHQYASRNRRTSRMLIMLMTSVMTNSSDPDREERVVRRGCPARSRRWPSGR